MARKKIECAECAGTFNVTSEDTIGFCPGCGDPLFEDRDDEDEDDDEDERPGFRVYDGEDEDDDDF